MESLSFNQTLNLLNEVLLKEYDPLPSYYRNVQIPSKTSEPNNAQNTQNLETYKETFIESKYTIGDILKYKEQNEKARVLHESLEELANFVRKGFDFLAMGSALTSLGKALSLGAPEVGGKR